MGFDGLSASRKRSWATTVADESSSTGPLRHTIRSFSKREKMSSAPRQCRASFGGGTLGSHVCQPPPCAGQSRRALGLEVLTTVSVTYGVGVQLRGAECRSFEMMPRYIPRVIFQGHGRAQLQSRDVCIFQEFTVRSSSDVRETIAPTVSHKSTQQPLPPSKLGNASNGLDHQTSEYAIRASHGMGSDSHGRATLISMSRTGCHRRHTMS